MNITIESKKKILPNDTIKVKYQKAKNKIINN
jgi:hypothetical protein